MGEGGEGGDEGGPRIMTLEKQFGISMSITVSCIGTITNIISIVYFLRRKNRNLGDKYLVLLNSLDITICLYTTFANTVALKCGENGCGILPGQGDFRVNSSSIFETMVELSGVATCFLCALRAISISKPLFQINKRKVYISTALAVFYIIAGKSIMVVLKKLKLVGKNDDESHVSTTMKLSLINIGIMVAFVVICLVVSIRGLKKTRPERAEQGTDPNEKATKMILILGLIFLAFNATWMATLVYYMVVEGGKIGSTEKDIATVQTATYILMSINSATNPVVYMTRNEEMNKHLRKQFNRVKMTIYRSQNL